MATQTLCKTCNGYGQVVTVRETTMYACGWVQEMKTCPVCKGTRVAQKPLGAFRKLLVWVGAK